MSFSQKVKDEILKKSMTKIDARAALQGLLVTCGSLIISDGSLAFSVSNENENVILFAKQKIAKFSDVSSIKISKIALSFKQKEKFELSVDGQAATKILTELGFVRFSHGGIEIISTGDKSFLKSEPQMLGFLIGVFLGGGTVSVPSDENQKRHYGYHFEVVLEQENQADLILEMFSNFDIFPKKIQRNEQYVIYLKSSEAIFDVLTLFGSSKAVLSLLADKVERDVMNTTNRQMNCYTANMDKTVNAAVNQVKAIEVLQNTIGLENLPDTLSEAALARLANPESSLSDLLKVLNNKISKGALAQRFKRIIELAAELGDDDDK